MHIVLIGFMGCGKSSIGRALAKHIGAWHIDTDNEIEKQEGMSVAEVFSQKGEDYFRQMETQIVKKLAGRKNGRPLVISTGGGLPLTPENADILKQIGPVVWLRASPETIAARVGPRLSQRPLVADYAHDLIGRIQELLAQREPVYGKVADRIVLTDGFAKPSDVAIRIMEEIDRSQA